MFDLRPYQEVAVDRLLSYLARAKEKGNAKRDPLVALPTGSGKTIVIAETIRRLNEPVLVISHNTTILEQNHESFIRHVDNDACGKSRTVGIHSAGLSRREVCDVTFATIGSIWRNPQLFKHFEYVIIDECHQIPHRENGMYNKFLAGIGKHTLIGLTATPFRLGWGYIYGEDRLFDQLVIDYSQGEKMVKLIDDGYLCQLSIKATKTKMDTDAPMLGGDFDLRVLSRKNDIDAITEAACKELVEKAKDRKKWLIFAIDISHAENVAEKLISLGIKTMVVHSKMEFDKGAVLKKYKEGHYQAMVNVNMLSTGFDAPDVDCIGMLRPTNSNVLHIQTIGRGLRIAEGKKDCLVLDFAGNTARLGPINAVRVRNRGQRIGSGEPNTKECPECKEILAPAVRICPACGYKFVFKTRLERTSGSEELISRDSDKNKKKWHKVTDVAYAIHKKKGRPDSLCVMYYCGLVYYKEWIHPAHSGYAKHYADNWAKARGIDPQPSAQALLNAADKLSRPNMIKIDKSGLYHSVTGYSF